MHRLESPSRRGQAIASRRTLRRTVLAPADFAGLVERTREWADLQRLNNGLTPQRRGQRFNGFLAEMLRCWDIEARASQRDVGEIDVAFRVADQRFILEAKWEATAIDTGPLAKLKTRVQQRLAGVLGVFVSMSGYTADARHELNLGQRSEVLLLDRQHVEAMLSGVVSPLELFDALLDHAFYTGRPYAPIEELLAARPSPALKFGSPAELNAGISASEGLEEVNVVVADIPIAHLGFVEDRDGVLLVATTSGILEVNLSERSVTRLVDLGGCTRRPLRVGRDIYFVRGAGVGRLSDGRLTCIGGPFLGSTTLLQGPRGAPWVLSNGDPFGSDAQLAAITELGKERRYDLPYSGANSRNAVWLGEERFAVSGNLGTLVSDLASGEHRIIGAIGAAPNPDGVMRLSDRTLLMASDGTRLWEVDLSDGSMVQRARIALPDSGHELQPARRGTAYLSCPTPSHPGTAAILRLQLANV